MHILASQLSYNPLLCKCVICVRVTHYTKGSKIVCNYTHMCKSITALEIQNNWIIFFIFKKLESSRKKCITEKKKFVDIKCQLMCIIKIVILKILIITILQRH